MSVVIVTLVIKTSGNPRYAIHGLITKVISAAPLDAPIIFTSDCPNVFAVIVPIIKPIIKTKSERVIYCNYKFFFVNPRLFIIAISKRSLAIVILRNNAVMRIVIITAIPIAKFVTSAS